MSSSTIQALPSVSLFLPAVPAGGVAALAKSVGALLGDLGLPVQSTEDSQPGTMRFLTSGPAVLVSLQASPLASTLTDGCERPEHGQALDQYALRKLESHKAVIGITVEDTRNDRADARSRQALALTLRLARGLVGETGADLVLWQQTHVLYTVGEFSSLGQLARQRRSAPGARAPAPKARPDVSGADAAYTAATAAPPGGAEQLRSQVDALAARPLGEGLRRRVEDLAAPLHAEALRRQTAAEPLPEPGAAPQPVPSRKAPPARLHLLLSWLGAAADRWLDDDGYPTLPMQVAVYAMTGLAALIWWPAGVALAAYNLLRRESLRVTVPALLALGLASYSGALARALAYVADLGG